MGNSGQLDVMRSRNFANELAVAGWEDSIWVLVVVVPGYVDLVRGLVLLAFMSPALS